MLFGQVDDLLAEVGVGTDADDHIFDEVIAVAEALVFEQLCLGLSDLNGEGVVGANGVFDFPFEFDFFLLFLFDEEELLPEASLQIAEDGPTIVILKHQR